MKNIVSSLMVKRRYLICAFLVLIIQGAISPYLYQFWLIENFEIWNEEREIYSSPFNSSWFDRARVNAPPPRVSPYGFPAPVTPLYSSRLDPARVNASPPGVSPHGFTAPVTSSLSSRSDPARIHASAPVGSPVGSPAPLTSLLSDGNGIWLTYYKQAVLLHSDHQDSIQGLLLLAIFTVSLTAVLPHLSKTKYPKKKQVLVVFIISAPFGNALFLIIGSFCTGVMLILLEGFQELYMNSSVVALGKLVLLNIRHPARLNKKKTRCLKFFIWQAIYIRCAGTVFQIVFEMIGYDFSSYELLFCFGYTISSVISGIAVYRLYKSGIPSDLKFGKSKMKFTKILDAVLIQDMYLRYIEFQHALKASIFLVEMLVTGIVLLHVFPVDKVAKKIRFVLKKVRIRLGRRRRV